MLTNKNTKFSSHGLNAYFIRKPTHKNAEMGSHLYDGSRKSNSKEKGKYWSPGMGGWEWVWAISIWVDEKSEIGRCDVCTTMLM